MRHGLNFEINSNIRYAIHNHVLALHTLHQSLGIVCEIRKQYKNFTISMCWARQHKLKTARLVGTDFTDFVVVWTQHGSKDKLKYDDWNGSAPYPIRIFSIKLFTLKSGGRGNIFMKKIFCDIKKNIKFVYTIFSLTTCFVLLNKSLQKHIHYQCFIFLY